MSRLPTPEGRAFLTAAVAKLPAQTLILDTEVCVFDKNLVSQFHLLSDAGDELATPPLVMAFDCLYVDGRDLRARPLHERREALERVVDGAGLIFPVRRLAE